jgi:hypothetical protein
MPRFEYGAMWNIWNMVFRRTLEGIANAPEKPSRGGGQTTIVLVVLVLLLLPSELVVHDLEGDHRLDQALRIMGLEGAMLVGQREGWGRRWFIWNSREVSAPHRHLPASRAHGLQRAVVWVDCHPSEAMAQPLVSSIHHV